MKTYLIIMLSLGFTCSLTGCAKIRQMTRRDFAVLNDPFLEDSAIADSQNGQFAQTAAAPAAASATGSEGYARVGDSRQTPPATRQSPFQTASRSRTIVPESTSAGLAKIASGEASQQQMPVATAAPSAQQMDMADMSAFMKQQAEASGSTETAKNLEADFEAFAAARQKEWNQQAQDIKQGLGTEVRQVADQVASFGETAMPSLPDMSFDDGFGSGETAEPLIRQMSGQSSSVASRARASVSEVVAEMPNPFMDQVASEAGVDESAFADNPFGFDEPSSSTSNQPFARQATARPSLSAAAANVRSATQNAGEAFNDFAAFADSQLTGKVSPQPSSSVGQSNPFGEFTPPAAKPRVQQFTNQAANGLSGFGTETPTSNSRTTSQKPETAVSKGKLDDKFGFDVGWRPANMERR